MEPKHTEKMHQGHRERMKNRYLRGGIESLDDYAILEMLLYNVYKVKDTYPIAHNLLDRFKTLDGVLNAPPELLLEVDGVGEKTIEFFVLIREAFERVMFRELMSMDFDNGINTRLLLTWRLRNAANDTAGILFAKGKKNIDFIVFDNCDGNDFDVCRIVNSYAEKYDGLKVVFVHKHPVDYLKPSVNDMTATESLKKYCTEAGMEFISHYIVTPDDCVIVPAD